MCLNVSKIAKPDVFIKVFQYRYPNLQRSNASIHEPLLQASCPFKCDHLFQNLLIPQDYQDYHQQFSKLREVTPAGPFLKYDGLFQNSWIPQDYLEIGRFKIFNNYFFST